MIPIDQARDVSEALGEGVLKEFCAVKDAGHNDLFVTDMMYRRATTNDGKQVTLEDCFRAGLNNGG